MLIAGIVVCHFLKGQRLRVHNGRSSWSDLVVVVVIIIVFTLVGIIMGLLVVMVAFFIVPVATAASRDDGSSRLLVLLLPTEATAERHFLKELEDNVTRIKSCILLS